MENMTDSEAKTNPTLQDRIKTGKQSFLVSLQQEIKSTEDKISSNTSKSRDIQEKIFERCKTLQEKLDMIASKYANLCRTTETENHRRLTIYKENLEAMLDKCTAELQEMEETSDRGSESDTVLAEETQFSTSTDPKNVPNTDDLQFRFKTVSDNELQRLFGDISSVKDISPESSDGTKDISPGEKGATATSSASPNIPCVSQFVLGSDTCCSCHCLHPLSSELYVWFYSSQFVSLVNKDGKVRQTINLLPGIKKDDFVRCFSVSPIDGTLWSATFNGCIQQVGQDGTLLKSFTVSSNCYSLCATRSQSLVVGIEGKVQMLTKSGKVSKKVKILAIRLIFAVGYIVQCRKTGRFALSDWHNVSVVDEKLRLLYTIHGETVTTADGSTSSTGYKPEETFHPCKMCFDVEGNLLVIDYSNSVIMFDNWGHFICIVTEERTEDKRPCAINTSPDGALWVAYEDNVFKQIKYKL